MIFKIVSPNSQNMDFANQANIIKISSKGLVGKDKKDFEKLAEGSFSNLNFKELSKPDEVLVHMIAIGANEYYGPNRWGDAFSENECRRCHPYFVKFARWYHRHKNKDPSKSYGIVKASEYNEKMKRIELIVALNASETAAERNGGLVAREEIEKLANGESLPVSMGCFTDHDICSGCKNKFKKIKDYCDSNICRKYGGLKNNKGKTFEDGHTLYADSIDPIFYDISWVISPADRIAYTTGTISKFSSEIIEDNEYVEILNRENQSSASAMLHSYFKAKSLDLKNELNSKLKILYKLASYEKNNLENRNDGEKELIKNIIRKEINEKFKNDENNKKIINIIKKESGAIFNGLIPISTFQTAFNLPTSGVNINKVASNLYSFLSHYPGIFEALLENPFDRIEKTSSYNLNLSVFNLESLRKKVLEFLVEKDGVENSSVNLNFEKIGEYNYNPLKEVKMSQYKNFNNNEKKLAICYGLYQISYLLKNKDTPCNLVILFNSTDLN
ncbi:MAG: hypothetical protein QW727_04410 [Candidatus Pacearchaeota archaeon]